MNFAIRELRREFPQVPAERLAEVVAASAVALKPTAGHVVLLQRARERL